MRRTNLRGKSWQELSRVQRVAIVLIGILQISLLIAALLDIRRRPASEINGSKRVWTVVALINFVGPIAYFIFGRKR